MAEAKLLNGMKLAGQVGSSGKRSMRTYTLVWQKPSYPTPRTQPMSLPVILIPANDPRLRH